MSASLSLRARLTVWYTVALLIVMALGGADGSVAAGTHRPRTRRSSTPRPQRHARQSDAGGTDRGSGPRDSRTGGSGDDHRAREEPWRFSTARARRSPPDGTDSHCRFHCLRLTTGCAYGQPIRPLAPGGCAQSRRKSNKQSLVLLTAAPLTDVLRERREVLEAMWVGIPIVLLLASLGGVVARLARFAANHEDGGTGRTAFR